MGYCGSVVMNYQSFGGDRGSWVYDRIIIVRCDNVIPEEKQDKNLIEHLLEEKEYIVSLAIKGLKQVIDNGYKYNIPASCELLNKDYEVENHSFRAFYKECVVPRPNLKRIDDKCTTKLFYDVYKEWCKDNNNGYKESKQQVNKILEEMGKGEKIKHNGYWYYKEITLSEDTKTDYEQIYNSDVTDDRPKYKAVNNNEDIGYDGLIGGIGAMDFDINNFQPDDLRPSEEELIEAGIYDIDVNNVTNF